MPNPSTKTAFELLAADAGVNPEFSRLFRQTITIPCEHGVTGPCAACDATPDIDDSFDAEAENEACVQQDDAEYFRASAEGWLL